MDGRNTKSRDDRVRPILYDPQSEEAVWSNPTRAVYNELHPLNPRWFPHRWPGMLTPPTHYPTKIDADRLLALENSAKFCGVPEYDHRSGGLKSTASRVETTARGSWHPAPLAEGRPVRGCVTGQDPGCALNFGKTSARLRLLKDTSLPRRQVTRIPGEFNPHCSAATGQSLDVVGKSGQRDNGLGCFYPSESYAD